MELNTNSNLIVQYYQSSDLVKIQKAKACLHNLTSKERRCFLIAIKPIKSEKEEKFLNKRSTTLKTLENKLAEINKDAIVNSKSTHLAARISRWIKNFLGLRKTKDDLIKGIENANQKISKKIDPSSLSGNRKIGYNLLIPLTKKIGKIVGAPPMKQKMPTDILTLEIPKDRITQGHGEYVVFRNKEGSEKTDLSPQIFSQVQAIFQKYSPTNIVNDDSDEIQEKYEKRYQLILEEVKKIDPELEIAFIPRSLYELMFIKKGIQEDIKYLEICPKMSGIDKIRHKCWHLEPSEDGKAKMNSEAEDIAYRLNKVMIKTLNPTAAGFTHEQLKEYLNQEIAFFQQYKEKYLEFKKDALKQTNSFKLFEDFGGNPTPTRSFGLGDEFSTTDEAMQIVRNSLDLECSKVAQHSFLLYRASILNKDQPFASVNGKENPYSLSYGTSLFAGAFHDTGASTFHYVGNNNEVFVIPVSFKKLKESPFYIPTSHTIIQITSKGESFHPRTKIWKNAKKADLVINKGMGPYGRDGLTALESEIPKDQLLKDFNDFNERAIHLK